MASDDGVHEEQEQKAADEQHNAKPPPRLFRIIREEKEPKMGEFF